MKLESQPLPESLLTPLLTWLNQPEFETLSKVLRERADRHEWMAMESRRQSEGGVFPKYELQAKQEVANADLVYAMIKLLRDYQQKKIPLETIQVKLE